MATVNSVQKLRGTAAQNAAVTLPEGVIVYLTDTKQLAVHDGSTAGGTIFSAEHTDADAEDVGYDNSTSGLTADDVQAAIDEIVSSLPTILQGSKTYDPAAGLDYNETITTTVTVTGAAVDDACIANHSAISGNTGIIQAEITSTNTATVKFNTTSDNIDISSGTLTVTVIQP